jgi:hypothetical protein
MELIDTNYKQFKIRFKILNIYKRESFFLVKGLFRVGF